MDKFKYDCHIEQLFFIEEFFNYLLNWEKIKLDKYKFYWRSKINLGYFIVFKSSTKKYKLYFSENLLDFAEIKTENNNTAKKIKIYAQDFYKNSIAKLFKPINIADYINLSGVNND